MYASVICFLLGKKSNTFTLFIDLSIPKEIFLSTKKIINRAILLFGVSNLLGAITVMMPLCYKFHRQSFYPTGYFPDIFYWESVHKIALPIYLIYEFWFEQVCWAGNGLQVFIMLLFFKTVITSLEEITR